MRLEIKNIKKGDKMWERARCFVALEDARTETIEMGGKTVNQYFVWAKPVNKSPVTAPRQVRFLETEGAEHYGPKLEADSISHIAESQIEHIPTLKDYTGWFYNLGDDVK